uniref:CSON004186 protein n=1 Tax=Culicoides sonorensis TaxID=179676 RepID=A0A336M5B6_CULSO
MRRKRLLFQIIAVILGCISSLITFKPILFDILPYRMPIDGSVELDIVQPPKSNQIDSQIYKIIENRVRILCWTVVKNQDKNNEMRNKFDHIYGTWGQKCTEMLFLSDDDVKLNEHHLNRSGSEIVEGLKYLRKNGVAKKFDWILKFDANIFIIMENLRQFFLPYTTVSDISGKPLIHASIAISSSIENIILILNNGALDRLDTNYKCENLKYCCQDLPIYFFNVKSNELSGSSIFCELKVKCDGGSADGYFDNKQFARILEEGQD